MTPGTRLSEKSTLIHPKEELALIRPAATFALTTPGTRLFEKSTLIHPKEEEK
jgi:hypothetical protein